jgi:hypothetical protein
VTEVMWEKECVARAFGAPQTASGGREKPARIAGEPDLWLNDWAHRRDITAVGYLLLRFYKIVQAGFRLTASTSKWSSYGSRE